MKSPTYPVRLRTACLVLASFWTALCAAIVAAPLLASGPYPLPGGFLYLSFTQVCHQNPERSFFLRGHPFAVCHRCSGIYFGLLIGSLLGGMLRQPAVDAVRRRWWVMAGAVPLVIDALAPMAGLWNNTPLTRAATGMLFGIMVSSLLHAAAAELFDSEPADYQVHGGFS